MVVIMYYWLKTCLLIEKLLHGTMEYWWYWFYMNLTVRILELLPEVKIDDEIEI